MKLEEAANFLDTSKSQVSKWVKQGRLTTNGKKHNHYRIDRATAERLNRELGLRDMLQARSCTKKLIQLARTKEEAEELRTMLVGCAWAIQRLKELISEYNG
jgi:hypothetical protein